MIRSTLTIVIATLALTVSMAAYAEEVGTMPFAGELTDDQSQPISGTFILTFKLYDSAESMDVLWTEPHFVSAYNGYYEVDLGVQVPIPAELVGRELHLATELGSVGEFTRVPVTIDLIEPPLSREEIIASIDVTYSDLAERAIYAEEATTADDCVRLGGRTIDELDRFDELLSEIVELRQEVESMTRPTVGSRTTTLERVGGSGGNPYSVQCPPGHVVIGMRGGHGALVDSITLVCAPLE